MKQYKYEVTYQVVGELTAEGDSFEEGLKVLHDKLDNSDTDDLVSQIKNKRNVETSVELTDTEFSAELNAHKLTPEEKEMYGI